jgi:drug/metabolite transporter (DMT)-like permease
MFATMALLALPLAWVTMQTASDWVVAYGSTSVLLLTFWLVVCCTLIAFVLMNRWQPLVPAAEAGLIYAAEPVFASLFALCMPAWLSVMAGILYPNEKATTSLLVGGGLITLANVLLQLRPGSFERKPEPPAKRVQAGEPALFDSPSGRQ